MGDTTHPLMHKRRQEILAAAMKCFADKGFKATTMQDIARAVGMSAGNLYNYFEGKDSIVEELARRELAAREERIRKSNEVAEDWELCRQEIRELILSRLNSVRARICIDMLAESLRNDRMLAVFQSMDAQWRQLLLSIYMKTGRYTEQEAFCNIEANMAAMDGVFLRILMHPKLDKEALASELVDRIIATHNRRK
ncbi:MAG: TetR/AcrR family transcriptional regulator [Duodenibacillus sp.]|nr:TetR/AcrR family transcriptional regulator [Duodenibacillus sp.]